MKLRVRFRGMRVELPKGEYSASKGRKYNKKLTDSPGASADSTLTHE